MLFLVQEDQGIYTLGCLCGAVGEPGGWMRMWLDENVDMVGKPDVGVVGELDG